MKMKKLRHCQAMNIYKDYIMYCLDFFLQMRTGEATISSRD